MSYSPQNFEHLIGIDGLSEQLMRNHFKLYEGYVTNTNKLLEKLDAAVQAGDTATPEYAELKRRLGWEFNGMRLHEYYFGNMTKEKTSLDGTKLLEQMKKDFGSGENCEKDFKATGAMRGIGWTILYYDPKGKRLVNVWINEHDVGHFAGGIPILVLDVFEHAYMLDYGINRAGYIETFVKCIDWKVAAERFDEATKS